MNCVLLQFNLDDGERSKLQTPPDSDEEKASHTVIDQIVWKSDKPVHDLPDPMFLPFMSHLRVLEFYVDPHSTTIDYFSILTFFIRSLRVGSPVTLEHLNINITIHINNEMLDNNRYYQDLYLDEVWSYLDSMATHPAGSRLQRVSVDVSFHYDYDHMDGDADLELILDELPSLQERGILFTRDRPWNGGQC